MENLRRVREQCESLFGGAFRGAQFVDEAVYVLFANALAASFRAAVGVDVIPPGAAFVMSNVLRFRAKSRDHGFYVACVGTGAFARPSRARLGRFSRRQFGLTYEWQVHMCDATVP